MNERSATAKQGNGAENPDAEAVGFYPTGGYGSTCSVCGCLIVARGAEAKHRKYHEEQAAALREAARR